VADGSAAVSFRFPGWRMPEPLTARASWQDATRAARMPDSVPVACPNEPNTADIERHSDDNETEPDQHRGS
jgi:hypothetical protein